MEKLSIMECERLTSDVMLRVVPVVSANVWESRVGGSPKLG
ncbi:hypothetical protein PF002_g20932 [Phytophthora fragariae]|uniref:Uncharacterized protein n=1 Tax=Phytophthora fragariae TaxID=53985 RepID=A0A6A3XLN7_9STRA|nr:hypothetical protein PF011_g21453 [Phytophthora fragariae]KAE9197514.1 hypothetical protein PF004_g19804 [Phytophthora fragariae]KAE9203430.1 hypothetical protein PF002_g20932 [Phytophthora fragariae]